MYKDPIVEEVREIRRRLWEECGGDLDRYLARLKVSEAKHGDRLVTLDEVEQRRRTVVETPKDKH